MQARKTTWLAEDTEKRHVPLPKRTGSRKDTGTSDAYPTPDDDQSASSREYDERASPMWQVYLTEAESHDKALIETWAKDMEGVVLFAGLFSASLTAFLVESYKQLQPDSDNQTETLSQQTVFLLTQIANQIGANGTGFITPAESTVLLDFSPKPSAVRINICWFLSLVLSFTAALFATIVQQWVRDYMQSSFQRYSSPLKRARIRQYLFEGASAHKMSVMVDLIPGLIHASLFLFFAGLCDFLFALNNTVAALTSACIAACVIVYMFTLVAPTINAQTPFQSPLSGAFWYIFQSVRRTEYCDKSTGNKKRLVSRNMAEGRVQLAMHDSEQRLERDARAIGWVVDSLTEDADLEPFVTGIPGSLSTKWGREVWAAVAKRADADRLPSADENAAEKMSLTSRSTSMSLGHLYDADAVADLSGRITRLLRTCIDPGILDAKVRRRRARACVDAALALVLNMRGKWQWFAAEADVMAQTLRYLAEDPGSSVAAAPTTAVAVMDTRKTWDPPPPLADPNFRSRWMCMSVMTVHALLRDDHIRDAAGDVVKAMAEAAGNSKLNEDAAATQTAALLDKLVKKAWYGARKLRETLERDDAESTPPQRLYDDAREWIRTLDYHWNVLGWAGTIDDALVRLTDDIADTTEHIVAHMPGAQLRLENLDIPLMPHFVRPRHLAQRLAQTSWRLHELHTNNWAGAPPRLADLCAPELRDPVLARQMSAVAAGRDGFARPFREQLWRLQDLAAGGMLYVLELLLAAARVDGNVRSADTREHYVGTFTAVTARWRDLRSSNAVRNGVGVLLREVLLLPGKEPPTVVPPPPVPPYLVEEMLKLVANVFKGTSGPEVDVVVGMVERYAEGLVKGDLARKTAEEVAAKLMPKKSGRTHEEAQSL